MNPLTSDNPQTPPAAASMFASTDVTSQNLEALLCMAWQQPSTTAPTQPSAHSSTADAAQLQAKISALVLQAAAPILGVHDLTSSELSSKQGSSGLIHKALQDSDASLQAAAIVLLPVVVANTAEAAKGSARGQPIVGIRLLQKGLDCLSDVMQQGSSAPGIVKVALAHALGGFVSMQAVSEHRATALCKASEALFVICQSGRTTTGKDSSTSSGKPANGPFSFLFGLQCWPVLKQNLQALPVTGHGGASVPVKAIRSFADVLLSQGHEGPRCLEKVPYVACLRKSHLRRWCWRGGRGGGGAEGLH